MDDPHTIFSRELEALPSVVKPFLKHRPRSDSYYTTWESFCGAYGRAFDSLSAMLLEEGRDPGQLGAPIFFLCRHSIELSIKWAIIEHARSAGENPKIEGHSLIKLWRELLKQFELAGFPSDDDWTVYCGKLVEHIHNVDPDGERFRYPESRQGTPFGYTAVELKELAVAHWHIGMLCDGAGEMLQALGRQC